MTTSQHSTLVMSSWLLFLIVCVLIFTILVGNVFNLSLGELMFVLLVLNIAISVPVSFANVGPFEAAIALALTSFGMDGSKALAVATVHHAIQLITIGLGAAVSVFMRRR